MRELKFRVWVNDYGRYLNESERESFVLKLDGSYHMEIKVGWLEFPATIEQYTGLKDKNGKEIYEGDIVKGGWLYGKDEHVVKYRDYGFYPFFITDFDGDPMIRNVDIEVIGNIHENPELTEGKEK